MHPNPIYHTAEAAQNLDFARHRGFGVLSVNGTEGPHLGHVPFALSADGKTADLHLMRSNPIARGEASQAAVIAVSGADSYVSPDWYGMENQVPTWNYVAIHLRGTLERLPDADLRGVLERESALFEARLAPKPEWLLDKMDPEALARLERMIVPFRLHVGSVDGTWKLAQNKPPEARRAAAAEMDAWGFGTDPRVLAAQMRAVPGTEPAGEEKKR